MTEFSQRLIEAANVAERLRKDSGRSFWLDVTENGIAIRTHAQSWGDKALTKIVSYKEIEQCRINPLTAMINRMIEELSTHHTEVS